MHNESVAEMTKSLYKSLENFKESVKKTKYEMDFLFNSNLQ